MPLRLLRDCTNNPKLTFKPIILEQNNKPQISVHTHKPGVHYSYYDKCVTFLSKTTLRLPQML